MNKTFIIKNTHIYTIIDQGSGQKEWISNKLDNKNSTTPGS